jgi:hypothetical protein
LAKFKCPKCGRELSNENIISEELENLGPTTRVNLIICQCGHIHKE